MKVRELREALMMFSDDAELLVCDRSSWDAANQIMTDPETHPDVALAFAFACIGGFEYRRTNDLADIRSDGEGPMLVITGKR